MSKDTAVYLNYKINKLLAFQFTSQQKVKTNKSLIYIIVNTNKFKQQIIHLIENFIQHVWQIEEIMGQKKHRHTNSRH